MEHIGGKISYFCVGLGIGAVVAIAMAPRSGEETRELIAEKLSAGKTYARRKAQEVRERAQEVVDRGVNAVSQQAESISAAFDAGRETYRREKADAND